jgi:hypothetical protein
MFVSVVAAYLNAATHSNGLIRTVMLLNISYLRGGGERAKRRGSDCKQWNADRFILCRGCCFWVTRCPSNILTTVPSVFLSGTRVYFDAVDKMDYIHSFLDPIILVGYLYSMTILIYKICAKGYRKQK